MSVTLVRIYSDELFQTWEVPRYKKAPPTSSSKFKHGEGPSVRVEMISSTVTVFTVFKF